jgi:hypothetical protein
MSTPYRKRVHGSLALTIHSIVLVAGLMALIGALHWQKTRKCAACHIGAVPDGPAEPGGGVAGATGGASVF